MPQQRGQRGQRKQPTKRQPSAEWVAFQAVLIHPGQVEYELVRPVVTGSQSIKDRANEVGLSERTVSRKVERFYTQFSLPWRLDGTAARPEDKRQLPQDIREAILQLKAEYPAFTPREIANVIEVQADRSVDHKSIRRMLTRWPLPKVVNRRFPYYRQLKTPAARREAIIRLHLEGWSTPAIIEYLHAPPATVYDFLRRWAQDVVVKPLGDRKRGRPPGGSKVTLPMVARIKELQEQTTIGEFRMAAAIKQQFGEEISPRTCGRIMARHRDLYGLLAPAPTASTPRKPMPFATSIPHRWWSLDLCYIEKHQLPDLTGPVYIWTILDNASRKIVASAPSKTQNIWDFLLVLFTAIHVYGAPLGLVSDSSSVFTAMHRCRSTSSWVSRNAKLSVVAPGKILSNPRSM